MTILLPTGVITFGVKSLVAPAPEASQRFYSDSLGQYIMVQGVICIVAGGIALAGLLSRPVRRDGFVPSRSF